MQVTHPYGSFLAIAGGLMAQDPNPGVSTVGLIVGLTGLAGGLLQYWRAWLDNRLAMRRLDVQEDKTNELVASLKEARDHSQALELSLAATSKELADARDRNHAFQDATAGTMNSVQAQVYTNTQTIQKLVPAVGELSEQTGFHPAIPEPPPLLIEPCPDAPKSST